MSLKKSMILGIIGLCTLSAIILSLVFIILNSNNSQNLNSSFREFENKNYQKQLKNYVNMAYTVLKKHYSGAMSKERLIADYGDQLKQVIDIAYGTIDTNYKKFKDGTITEEEAKNNVLETIKKVRFDNGNGYIWINDTGKKYPKMVMHPTLPELDGKILDDAKYNCANGEKKENLFVTAVNVCEKDGSGYIDYLWPKPTSDGVSEEYKQKLSYVRIFKEWNWVLGTGIYVELAMEDAKKAALNELKQLRYDEGIGYFWVNDTTKPFPKMVMHPTKPELDGKVMDDEEYNCAGENNENLFVAFNKVCENNGQGYVDYMWPKPTASGTTDEKYPKLSYVKLFKEWNWIVGSGVYTDDVEAAIDNQQSIMNENNIKFVLTIIITIAAIIGLAIFFVYLFMSKKILGPINEIVEYLTQMAKGNLKVKCNVKESEIAEFKLIKNHIQNTINELSSLISNINNEASHVYHTSNETKKHIEVLKANLDDISSTTEELSSSVEETAATTEEMYTIADELEGTTKEVFSNIKNKSGSVQDTINYLTSSTDKLLRSITTMTKGISELAAANTQNAVGTTEIAKSVSDISIKAEQVANQSDTLKRTAFKLMESIGVFTTK